jgi:ribosomal protein S18 acetylase RimI-like enzyme
VCKGTAEVDVSRTDHGRTLDPDVREEIVRLFWQSRLYPLTEIRFGTGESATLTGAEAKRLSRRYGPRPYGPRTPEQSGFRLRRSLISFRRDPRVRRVIPSARKSEACDPRGPQRPPPLTPALASPSLPSPRKGHLTMDLRIQRAVVANLSTRPHAIESGPFVLGLDHGTDSPHINYATPVPGAEITAADVAGLVTAFGGRPPRLEYVTSCAPDLEKLLLDAGFAVEARNEYLTCTPATLVDQPVPAGYELFVPETDEEIGGVIAVQNEAFGSPGAARPADIDRHRRVSRHGGVFVGARTTGGRCAGGAGTVVPSDGVCEVGGIAVGAAHRRRGLAGAITAETARRLFASGIEVAWLEAGGDDSWRVYERVGFRPSGQRLYVARY